MLYLPPPKKKVATNGYRPQMMAWLCLVQVIPNKATSETTGSSCGNPDSFQSRFGHSSEERRKSSKVCFNHIVDSMQSESSIERAAVTSSNHSLSELQLVYKLHKVPRSCDVKRWCDIPLEMGNDSLSGTSAPTRNRGALVSPQDLLGFCPENINPMSDPDQFECLLVRTAISFETSWKSWKSNVTLICGHAAYSPTRNTGVAVCCSTANSVSGTGNLPLSNW